MTLIQLELIKWLTDQVIFLVTTLNEITSMTDEEIKAKIPEIDLKRQDLMAKLDSIV